ncbi:hypothetical protein PA7_33650 [Pseudonocardia asaccharolytica DSM 44247 = NBRC 16224]|uniref:Uncharacterized protein n=1 Tax=Pseudonocardia asaccharolytica DSM 44247 = NBRC 16224 TaxID=1123024 RepID=A0A511D999_9PSEU|nr:hypothetical protein PA7_33650 [Pseudonocardia asaccharolytica DSM 44247 = NBRC 16224]
MPSSLPRVAAKPLLVVASAGKPSAASSRAEPASHGLGMSSGRPGTWSARKASTFAVGLVTVLTVATGAGNTISIGYDMCFAPDCVRQ